MPFSKLIFKVSLLLLSIFVCQACSLTGETKGNNDQSEELEANADIKTIGKSMLELGDIPKKSSNDVLVSSANKLAANSESNTSTKIHTKYQKFKAQQATLKSQFPANIYALYISALTEMKKKNWQLAIELLDDVIEQYPNLSEVYLNNALAHYQLNQLDLAVTSLHQAEKVNPINPFVYNLQGIIAREQGQFIEAEKYYQQALAIWPDYPEAHLNSAVFFELYRGKFIQAKKHYQAYLMLKPGDVKTKRWLAGLEIKLASRKGS